MIADRAYLPGARAGARLAHLEAEVARILDTLGPGALRVDPAALQPADVLLDLYGEDIRARAFTARDDGADMMLRPDFTVPIARMHMGSDVRAARYVYCGPVWRRQEAGSTRPREFLQAGLEIYGEADEAAADAEVLALVSAALGDASVTIVTGDIGLVLAAVAALDAGPARKAALRRHVWRPDRFRALLRRYGPDHAKHTAARAPLLAAMAEDRLPEMIGAAGAAIGRRSAAEITARAARLAEEARTPPLAPAEIARLEAILAVRGTCREAFSRLAGLADGVPDFERAVAQFGARLDAIDARGIETARLAFDASFGRMTMEYYDGFVFGAAAKNRSDLPPIASGGRYDALTAVLGQGQGSPAVGGIIRPEALVALREGVACA